MQYVMMKYAAKAHIPINHTNLGMSTENAFLAASVTAAASCTTVPTLCGNVAAGEGMTVCGVLTVTLSVWCKSGSSNGMSSRITAASHIMINAVFGSLLSHTERIITVKMMMMPP